MNDKIYVSIYLITNFVYGTLFSSFGPLVPFLSSITQLPESHFTIIFTMRGLGYLLGGFAKHIFFNSFDMHRGMGFGCLGTAIGCCLFTLSLKAIWLAAMCFLISICLFILDIFINVSLMQRGRERIKLYMTLSYTFLSLGNIAGSFLVSKFGTESMVMMGISWIVLTVVYFLLPSFSQDESQDEENEKELISPVEESYFCLLFMMYAAFTLSFRSWIPSFSVMLQIQQKEQAALLLSSYSITQLSLRTIFLFIQVGVANTLKYCTIGSLFYPPFIILLFLLGFRIILVYTIVFGIALLMFLYFPFLYALPDAFNKRLITKNASKMMTFYAIGETCLSSIGGYLMEWIHPLALFGYMFVLIAFMYYGFVKCVQSLGKKQRKSEVQIPLQEI